jgi:16S rRNA (cytidine1402-2'-O)-methyltransferase
MHQAGLFVVATPIGNLEDITHRAVGLLAAADLVAAEDTRRTRVLLAHYDIRTRLLALHEHNEQAQIPALLERIGRGEMVALVSDAGTPLVSDPGFRLVRAVAEAGLPVIPVPGPSALTAALSVAGLPTDRFVFEGFLPARPAARRKRLAALSGEHRTLVFFESSHRIEASLADLAEAFGGTRPAVICRELTKQFETVLRGSLEQLGQQLAGDANQRRGEFVVLVEGAAANTTAQPGVDLARALLEYLPASQAARVAAQVTGATRRDIYAALEDRPDAGNGQD